MKQDTRKEKSQMHTQKKRNRWFIIIISAFIVLLAGCATTVPQRAQTLASSGIQLATSSNATLHGIAEEFESTIEATTLVKSLPGSFVAELTPKSKVDIQDLAKRVRCREKVVGSLQKTYSAYSSLATYNAREEFEAALAELTLGINQLADASSPGTVAISEPTGNIIVRTGGLLAQQVQKHALQNGSKEIRLRLEEFQRLLKADQEVFNAIVDFTVNQKRLVAKTLYQSGFSSPTPIVQEHAEKFGLLFDPKAYSAKVESIQQNAPEIAQAHMNDIVDVISLRASRYIDTQQQILSAQIAAVDDLIKQHSCLEEGEKLSLQTLRANIAILQSYADDLAAIRAERQANSIKNERDRQNALNETVRNVISMLQTLGKLPVTNP